MLTYAIAEHPESQFQWISRTGDLLQLVGEGGPIMTFDLAPDGTRIVFCAAKGHTRVSGCSTSRAESPHA